ncbi:DNA polymerase IV [Paenalcaligenes niemegkensis]|uniref:DNA polymerase IV n=1 Tax=Paenalcaligenes niemegkensis TaxID=2895469 RepID=UPI001EE87EED|nr:DNA polymerase IV [Paenalcaligenes niemegkensis]MCQ9617874.1 DNA polymerase IV [Paenalcaligenes niemegkensis]
MSNSQPERRIAHLDMDAFYASVELLRYPDLRGHAVVIGGRSTTAPLSLADGTRRYAQLAGYTGRGVVTTSTYEARALGVFSAMGLMKAAELAPEAYLLPADFEAYRHYSRLFKQAVASVSERIENRGIDEIYIDLSHLDYDTEYLVGLLKERVFEATGLHCSIGVTPNKLLSKIASDLNKPNGVSILSMDDIPSVIWPLAVNKINGVGPKAYQKLQALGIERIGDLAAAAPATLQEHFGASYAYWLTQVAQGIDDRPLDFSPEPKSISRETTFERNMHVRHDRHELSALFLRLCSQLELDLRNKAVRAQTIGVKVRFHDFSTVTRDSSVDEPVLLAADIHQAAGLSLRRVPFTNPSIRLFGVKASNLLTEEECQRLDEAPRQLSLYDDLL